MRQDQHIPVTIHASPTTYKHQRACFIIKSSTFTQQRATINAGASQHQRINTIVEASMPTSAHQRQRHASTQTPNATTSTSKHQHPRGTPQRPPRGRQQGRHQGRRKGCRNKKSAANATANGRREGRAMASPGEGRGSTWMNRGPCLRKLPRRLHHMVVMLAMVIVKMMTMCIAHLIYETVKRFCSTLHIS